LKISKREKSSIQSPDYMAQETIHMERVKN